LCAEIHPRDWIVAACPINNPPFTDDLILFRDIQVELVW
jgi:hypothetical protein